MNASPADDADRDDATDAHRDRGRKLNLTALGAAVPRLQPVQPRTMVEQAAEAIVSAAARGLFLPDDRLVEAEIARDLGISRVPVREALRLLESQGIVANTPYKGMRLMSVSNRFVTEITSVRRAIECLALNEAMSRTLPPAAWGPLREAVAEGRRALSEGRHETLVEIDHQFHLALCRISENTLLLRTWQALARQLQVVWSLLLTQGDLGAIDVHEELLRRIDGNDRAGALELLGTHIDRLTTFDFEALLAARREARNRAERSRIADSRLS